MGPNTRFWIAIEVVRPTVRASSGQEKKGGGEEKQTVVDAGIPILRLSRPAVDRVESSPPIE